MKKAWLFAVAVAWVASLFGVGLWAQSVERSFSVSPDGQITAVAAQPTQVDSTGSIITGENFGFRLGSVQGNGTVTGTVVVKLGGRWFDVSSPMELRPAVR